MWEVQKEFAAQAGKRGRRSSRKVRRGRENLTLVMPGHPPSDKKMRQLCVVDGLDGTYCFDDVTNNFVFVTWRSIFAIDSPGILTRITISLQLGDRKRKERVSGSQKGAVPQEIIMSRQPKPSSIDAPVGGGINEAHVEVAVLG